MWLPYCAGIFLALCVLTYGDVIIRDERCKDRPDGVHDIGCRVYLVCQGGSGYEVECKHGQVFNYLTEKCDDPIHVPPPCGVKMDCTGLEDGRYPDHAQQCKFYYTCNGGKFFGHNQCPGELYFNPLLQICDWRHNILPPCGTKSKLSSFL